MSRCIKSFGYVPTGAFTTRGLLLCEGEEVFIFPCCIKIFTVKLVNLKKRVMKNFSALRQEHSARVYGPVRCVL